MGAFCTKIQRAEFLICVKQTADSAPSFGTNIPPFSAFFVYRRRARGAREGKQEKQE